MLEHQKIVLRGVAQDEALFRKELIKSMEWLNAPEQDQLRRWVRENFSHLHGKIIKEILDPSYANTG